MQTSSDFSLVDSDSWLYGRGGSSLKLLGTCIRFLPFLLSFSLRILGIRYLRCPRETILAKLHLRHLLGKEFVSVRFTSNLGLRIIKTQTSNFEYMRPVLPLNHLLASSRHIPSISRYGL